MVMIPGNTAVDTDLAEKTVAQILVDPIRCAALDNEFTEDMVTWVLDLNPALPLALLSDDQWSDVWCQDPRSLSHCHETAKKMFEMLTVKGAAKSCTNPTLDISSAHASAPSAFRVVLPDHSFVIVVRNGKAELLQSFIDEYTLGENLLQDESCFDFDALRGHLNNLSCQEVRLRLFVREVTSFEIIECEMAPLKTDVEIRKVSSDYTVERLDAYRTLLSRCDAAAICRYILASWVKPAGG